MKKLKKIFAVVLAIVILMTVVPLSGSALSARGDRAQIRVDNAPVIAQDIQLTALDAKTAASGTTINLASLYRDAASDDPPEAPWNFVISTRTLTLSGAGPYELTGEADISVVMTAANATVILNEAIIWALYDKAALTDSGGGCTLTITGTSSLIGYRSSCLDIKTNKSIIINGDGMLSAYGDNAPVIITTANIKMGDNVKASMRNGSGTAETYTFEKLSATNTHKWKLTGAATTGSLTAASIPVTVAAGTIGTVEREINPIAPKITGSASMAVTVGYAATSTGAYTVSGNPVPTVTKTSGDAKITWNNSTKKLGIAGGLAAGTYPVKLTALNGVSPNATYTFTLTVLPKAVSGGAAVSAEYNAIKVSWAKVTGAAGYEIYRSTSSGGTYTKVGTVTSGSTVTYTNTGLTTNKTYYYKVRAYGMSGSTKVYTGYSSVINAKPVPAKPTATITVGSYTSLKVSWGKISGASGYEVYRSASSGGTYTKVGTVTSGSTVTYTNTGLTTNKAYYYKVRAYRTVSNVKVYGSYSTVVNGKPVPLAPGGMKAASASYNSIKVSWSKVAGAIGYEVYRSASSGGTYSKVKTVTSGSAVSCTDTSLTTGKAYYYKVRAYMKVKSSTVYGVYSAVVNTKPLPAVPGGVKVASAGYNSVKVSWTKASGASGYEVYRSVSSGGTYTKVGTVASGSTVTFTNSGLTTGTTYYYKVRAYTKAGSSTVYGSYSAVAGAKPLPAVPGGVNAVSAAYDSVRVNWTQVTGAAGYEVYRSASSGGTYAKVGTAASGSTVTFTNSGLTTGTTYYYKVRAYTKVGSSTVYGSYSAVVNTKPVPAKPTAAAECANATSLKVSWGKIAGASGYEVYRSISSGGTYSLVKTVTSGDTVSYTNTGLTTNTTYYYKMRAFRTVSGAKVYGSYSTVVNAKPVSNISPTSVKIGVKTGAPYMPVTGGTCTLTATILPSNANTNTKITWVSQKTGVATIDQNGVVKAVGAGESVITATTANGKTASYTVNVAPDATSISFHTDKQPGGAVRYEMEAGDTVPMYMFKLTPANAYNVVTFTSSSTSVAEVVKNADGTYSLKGKVAGTATVTAKTHNGKTHSFALTIRPKLITAWFNQSPTLTIKMEPNTERTIAVGLTPANAPPNYVLTSSDPSIFRVENNSKIYAVKPGSAFLEIHVNGKETAAQLIEVLSPPPLPPNGSPDPGSGTNGQAYLKNYGVTYKSNGKAKLTLGIVPVEGANRYLLTEHKNYHTGMQTGDGAGQLHNVGNIKRWWIIEPTGSGDTTIEIDDVDTGRAFFSVAAYNGNTQLGSVFVGRIPVLYYPRGMGGYNEKNADAYVQAFMFTMWLYGPAGNLPYMVPMPPFAISIAFDKIPGAVGYDLTATCNGKDWGGETLLDTQFPGKNRCFLEMGYQFEEGTTIINVLPFVYDIDGTTKLYGEARTIVYEIHGGAGGKYWENTSTLANSVFKVTCGS